MKFFKLLLALSVFLMLTGCASTGTESTAEPKKKPTQHLKIADVTSMEDAKKIFIEKTAEIRGKKQLDVTELQEIHFITYTLEKSVAYLAENLPDEGQELAKQIAVVVEDIHINSEDNQKENTQLHLSNYFSLADKLIAGF